MDFKSYIGTEANLNQFLVKIKINLRIIELLEEVLKKG